MAMKSFGTPLQNIRDNNGNTHPWYMSGTASIDDRGTIKTSTHLESHIALSGFTGGMVAAFLNSEGQSIYTTPILQYGVDGYDVPSWLGGTPSPRTVSAEFHVDPSIYPQVDKINIFLFHDGKNRAGADLEVAWAIVLVIIKWIASEEGTSDTSTITSNLSSGFLPVNASSCGPACIFEHNNYAGRSSQLWPGRYDISQLTIGNDCISSVKVPHGWKVTLYEHAGFTGRTKILTRDTASLPDFNDMTSSIVVDGPACVFEHNNYGGRSQVLTPGRYDISQLTIGNDCVSSVKVPHGWKVTLYEHAGFTGRTKILTQDTASLPDFNDMTSSIVVEGM